MCIRDRATVDDPLSNAKFEAMVKKNLPLTYEELGGDEDIPLGLKQDQNRLFRSDLNFLVRNLQQV